MLLEGVYQSKAVLLDIKVNTSASRACCVHTPILQQAALTRYIRQKARRRLCYTMSAAHRPLMASYGGHVSCILSQHGLLLHIQRTAIVWRRTDENAYRVMARDLSHHHRAYTALMATLQNTMAMQRHAKPSP